MPVRSYEDVFVRPRMDSKKDRRALSKIRKFPPKLKDILRERWRLRMKENRRALLDEFRRKPNRVDIRRVIARILLEEARTLKEAPDWEDAFESDSSSADDEGQWIIQEYEKVLDEEAALCLNEWENEVICPLCERASLTETIDESVFCPNCQERFPDNTTCLVLKDVLDKNILNHNLACDDKSQFALISENASRGLYQLCDSCGLFVHLL